MTPERYRQIGELYHAALEVEADERAAFLERTCVGDAELRQKVESLINSNEQAKDFIEVPALAVAAELLADDADALTGQTIGRYCILSLLGAGGMGRVYLAEDTALSRRVALKLLPEHFTNDKNQVQRFRQEALAASALNHPNIVTVYEVGVWRGRDFIATEFVEGVTLRTRMRGRGLPLAAAIDIALQVTGALTAAHAAGIVHRDIKPENIMVRPDGLVKVLDFGIAKYAGPRRDRNSESWVKTATGVVIGTTAYMSPEQARGQEVDARADIWSLGVILYEMVARRLPFQGKTPTDRVAAILEREPEPLGKRRGIPNELEEIINRALVKDKKLRCARAADFAEDLRRLRPALGEERPFRFALPASSHGLLPSRWARSVALAALLLIIVASAAALYFRFGAGGKKQFDSRQLGASIDSIAVLPFNSLGSGGEDEFLNLGMADALITKLSNLRQIVVRPTSAVRKYAGAEQDPVAAGRELKVTSVLEGSIQRLGERIRVTVQLVSVEDGSPLWAEKFDEKLADIFALQDSISQRIAERLALKLTGEDMQRLTKRYTRNAEAYQLYLRGVFYREKLSEDALKKAVHYFEQATVADPNYALAYAGLASAYEPLSFFGYLPISEARPKISAAVTKALELDDALAEAHNESGVFKLYYEWDWAGGESAFRRALELNPNYALAHHMYANLLKGEGRFDEAIAERKRALEVDPLSLRTNALLGDNYYVAGRYDEAIEQYRKTSELDPDFFLIDLGSVYERKGMNDEAVAEYLKKEVRSGMRAGEVAALKEAYAASGMRGYWQKRLDLMKEESKQRRVPALTLAELYARIDEKDQAFEWLDKAYEAHELALIFLKVNPIYEGLRSDLRYQDLVRRVGLQQ
jgi:TolB-like protein/Flp pilus assembly protein TadD